MELRRGSEAAEEYLAVEQRLQNLGIHVAEDLLTVGDHELACGWEEPTRGEVDTGTGALLRHKEAAAAGRRPHNTAYTQRAHMGGSSSDARSQPTTGGMTHRPRRWRA